MNGSRYPEDFVGSTTEVFTGGGVGLTTLADGTFLRDAIAADAEGYLGAEHVARFGAHSELLVKLLNTGERLFVHFHPDGQFAIRHLGLPHGKTEAWIVAAIDHDLRPVAHLGFTCDIDLDVVTGWVEGQDVRAMLGAMHEVELTVGTTIFVPAGMPHSIGAGVTLVELQEPTDLSILLEYSGFPGIGIEDAFLGLESTVALSSLDRRGRTREELADLVSRVPSTPAQTLSRLLPPAAAEFFRADWLAVQSYGTIEQGFGLLVALRGTGDLRWHGGSLQMQGGDTILIPAGAGVLELEGTFEGVLCRPPAP